MSADVQKGAWETESGLIDDVDAWITNPHFGVKDEYSQVVVSTTGGEQRGVMLLFDLADENGEVIGNQGYSIGTGWEVSEDGLSISHPKRKNVVTGTLYGQLQNRVVKELGVDMSEFGIPTDAMVWDGLGFHWMQIAHSTVGGAEKTGLMPTAYLGKLGEEVEEAEEAAPAPAPKPTAKAAARPAAKPAAKSTVKASEQAALKLVAETGTAAEFMLKAVKTPEIAGDDELLAQCLNDTATGFFKTHKGK